MPALLSPGCGPTLRLVNDDYNLVAASSVAVEEVTILFLQSDSGEDFITINGNAGDRSACAFESQFEHSPCHTGRTSLHGIMGMC
jgi:hypothetical protein